VTPLRSRRAGGVGRGPARLGDHPLVGPVVERVTAGARLPDDMYVSLGLARARRAAARSSLLVVSGALRLPAAGLGADEDEGSGAPYADELLGALIPEGAGRGRAPAGRLMPDRSG